MYISYSSSSSSIPASFQKAYIFLRLVSFVVSALATASSFLKSCFFNVVFEAASEPSTQAFPMMCAGYSSSFVRRARFVGRSSLSSSSNREEKSGSQTSAWIRLYVVVCVVCDETMKKGSRRSPMGVGGGVDSSESVGREARMTLSSSSR